LASSYDLHFTDSGNADIIYVLSFSLHVVEKFEGNSSYYSSHSPNKIQLSGSPRWHVHSILDVPRKKNLKGVRAGELGGQGIGPPLPVHFSGNLRFKICSRLLCFGQLHVAKDKLQIFLPKFVRCCVACLIVMWYAYLIHIDCKKKPCSDFIH
jgi:hypothetical protein